ncbi:MAG: hypothetical protein HRU20_07040 [Pseudomonadales bacterium]|nr:hypothetical protein [Pseudomonadales bacterium]
MKQTKLVRLMGLIAVWTLLILCSSCDMSSDENKDQTVQEGSEEEAGLFSELSIDGDFTFETQRLVNIDIRFSQRQALTSLSLYSERDANTGAPTKLLEQAELHNADRYRTSITVPGYIQVLVAIIDGDIYVEQELSIEKDNRINFTFE